MRRRADRGRAPYRVHHARRSRPATPSEHVVLAGLSDLTLTVLATVRLIRLVTQDDLGRWVLTGPVERWALGHERAAIAAAGTEEVSAYSVDDPLSWQMRLARGAGCRWCVGFWVGVFTAGGTLLLRRGRLAGLWRLGMAVLGLNVVAVAVGVKAGTLD